MGILENMHMFSIEFVVENRKITGRLALTDSDDIVIDIGGFRALDLCDREFFDELCDGATLSDFKKGNTVTIDGNRLIIIDVETETIDEFNDFCDRADMEMF